MVPFCSIVSFKVYFVGQIGSVCQILHTEQFEQSCSFMFPGETLPYSLPSGMTELNSKECSANAVRKKMSVVLATMRGK